MRRSATTEWCSGQVVWCIVWRMDNVEETCQVGDIEHVAVRGRTAEATQGDS